MQRRGAEQHRAQLSKTAEGHTRQVDGCGFKGSKSEIYVLMRKLASEGKGVVMVSSELPELLSVCDRICVFRDGEIRMTYDISEATEEKIVKTSTGE